jgi:hypothetical protein
MIAWERNRENIARKTERAHILGLIVSHWRPYSPTPIPIRHDTLGASLHRYGAPPMPFDDPACFRFNRVPARPFHRLPKGYMGCAMLSRPAFHAFLPSGPPRKHVGLAGTHAFAGWGRHIVSEPARESMAHPNQGRPGVLAVVEFGPAARRQRMPMRVRPTDPCRAHCRPYGLGRRRIRSADGPSRDYDEGHRSCGGLLRNRNR